MADGTARDLAPRELHISEAHEFVVKAGI